MVWSWGRVLGEKGQQMLLMSRPCATGCARATVSAVANSSARYHVLPPGSESQDRVYLDMEGRTERALGHSSLSEEFLFPLQGPTHYHFPKVVSATHRPVMSLPMAPEPAFLAMTPLPFEGDRILTTRNPTREVRVLLNTSHQIQP